MHHLSRKPHSIRAHFRELSTVKLSFENNWNQLDTSATKIDNDRAKARSGVINRAESRVAHLVALAFTKSIL